MIKKEYDVFIAYHGTYEPGSSFDTAERLYKCLVKRGLNAFFFPECKSDTYKVNMVNVLKSKTFIFVCNDSIHRKGDGSIDQSFHYELSLEIDAFYALTQMEDEQINSKDSKVFVCNSNGIDGFKGIESKLHPLFSDRTHLFFKENDPDYDEVYEWIISRIKDDKPSWKIKTTSEIEKVYPKRSSMNQDYDLASLIANSNNIRCVGISNTEMTAKMDKDAMEYALNNGAVIELMFLDPFGKYTSIREKEENHIPGRIKEITISNMGYPQDMKKRLPDDAASRLHILTYDVLPRMNIIIIDNTVLLQYYANAVAGLDNPCFVIVKDKNSLHSPLYEYCIQTYETLKKYAKELQ